VLARDAALVDERPDLLAGEPAGALRRAEALGVERVRDLPAGAAGCGKPGDAGQERGEVLPRDQARR
jgi:hypothetical protein